MSCARSLAASLMTLSITSLCLSVSILGTAGHVLISYNSQQASLWWLPIWASHFDARGLKTLVGASVSIIILDGLTCGIALVKAPFARFMILGFAGITAAAALVETAFPAVVNNYAPGIDSMQTWTCQWSSIDGSPKIFSALCHESRFAYFATIPVFIIHLLVLGLAVQNCFVSRRPAREHEEKGEELGSVAAPKSLRSGLESDYASPKERPGLDMSRT